MVVSLRLTSLSEEHNDTAKSLRQSLCSHFPGSIMFNYSQLETPDVAPVGFCAAALECLFKFVDFMSCY